MSRPKESAFHRHRAYGPVHPACVASLLGAVPGFPCAAGEVQLYPGAMRRPEVIAAFNRMPWRLLPDIEPPNSARRVRLRLVGVRLYAETDGTDRRMAWTWAPEIAAYGQHHERRQELRLAMRQFARAVRALAPIVLQTRSKGVVEVRVHALHDDPLVTREKTQRLRTEDYLAVSLVLNAEALVKQVRRGATIDASTRLLANVVSSATNLMVRELFPPPEAAPVEAPRPAAAP